MGSGNGRTGTPKLNRYDLEDFSPHGTEDVASDAASPGPSDVSVGADLGSAKREVEKQDPAAPAAHPKRSEPQRIERRSPADAYKPLRDFLETFGSDTVMISFAALENMIKRELPPSARERVTWWTNKPRGQGHAKAWRDIGWHVEHVDLRKGRVVFTRLG